jgi:type IV pilus assembly protein PilQ
MRIMRLTGGLSALIAASLLLSNGVLGAADQPVVHVKTVVDAGSVRLEAQATGPFEYTSYRPTNSLFVLDLQGVSAGDPAGARVVASDLIKSYRVVPYAAGDKSMVRVEILLGQGLEPQLKKADAQDLVLTVSHAASVAKFSAPAASASIVPVTAGPGSIRHVSLAEANGKTQVNILGSAPLTYQTMRLRNPDRLVLDFPSSHLTASPKQIASNLDPVRDVRLAQFSPEVSRVVIDLDQSATYDVNTNDNTVTVSFAPNAANEGASQSASAVEVAAKPAAIPTPTVALPATYTKPGAALASQGSQIDPRGVSAAMATAQASGASQPAPGGQAPAAASAAAPDSSASVSPTSFAGGPSAAATPPPSNRYSGEPISVNLKDVDLEDFFRLVHEISGLNVVVDPAVKGSLTIVLDDVPWDQALDIVLRNNDLDKQLDGNVLRVATKATIKSEAQQAMDLAKAQSDATEVVTTTRVLSYAKATAIAVTIKKFLTPRGDILADDRSNMLIIRDVPSTFPTVDNLLRQLDRKSQQVEIEARVVAANRSFSRELGSQFGAAGAANSGHNTNTIGGVPAVGSAPSGFFNCTPLFVGTSCTQPTTATSASAGAILPLITNFGTGAPTGGLQYLFQSTNFALDAIIDAAEAKGVGKLLSRPKVITQNNEKATVKQGTKIPVQTVVNNTVSVQFVDAVLQLDVTPQITADGTVYMDVTVTNNQPNNAVEVQGIPEIITQSAETKVTVNDGATVVIGGIIVTNQQTTVNDVPVLGTLPVLGNLFKHTSVSTSSQELLFFLTPRILPN